MADVKIIDIDSEQWNMKDQNARDRLTAIENQMYKTTTERMSIKGVEFDVTLKKIAEDTNYEYHQFFFGNTRLVFSASDGYITIFPQNANTEKILSFNLNILQQGNAAVQQKTQHVTGTNNCGFVTYLGGLSSVEIWEIAGFGILRKQK